MQNNSATVETPATLPSWVPKPALRYLAHTETGAPIRALARLDGCHASTVLRQIQRYETRRDDVLIDLALRRLGGQVRNPAKKAGSPLKEKKTIMQSTNLEEENTLSETRLRMEAGRILRRLCENGAVLAVAPEMDKAVVVRENEDGRSIRTAIVEREIAEAMALKGWIACDMSARIARYHITRAGRGTLNHILAEAENKASGFADAQAPFAGQDGTSPNDDHAGPSDRSRRMRYNMSETPLSGLARRKDRDGQPFLSDDLVRTGERMREDFELAQMGPRVTQNWDRFLTGAERGRSEGGFDGTPGAARTRITNALSELGPGLGDVALRCCCYLEGLERAEKRLGWSARSGKIVLRIALQRLKRHYDGLGDAGAMIG